MREKSGRLLAISVDAPALSKEMRADMGLPFTLLCDTERKVIAAYGLVHEGGSPEGQTISVPAQILVRRDGSIAWSFVSRRITDRIAPARTLAAIAEL